MDWMILIRKAGVMGVLCSLAYHIALLLMGQEVSAVKVVLFTVVFVVTYFLWLLMVGAGRKR